MLGAEFAEDDRLGGDRRQPIVLDDLAEIELTPG